MTARFDRDTAVVATGEGRYSARVDAGWWIERGPNGGYLAAILVRALEADVADPARHLRSLTVHYLAPPVEGPAEIDVITERAGRTVSFLDARLQQGDRLLAIARAAFAASNEDGRAFADPSFPGYPPPDSIRDRPSFQGMVAMRDRYEHRHVMGLPWEEPNEQSAETGGWIRLAEPRPYDAALVAALSDAWYPAIFTRLPRPLGVPTIDLTVHVRSVDALHRMRPDDWMAVRFRTKIAAEGYLEEDGELWAPDGTLVAHSRQLGLLITR